MSHDHERAALTRHAEIGAVATLAEFLDISVGLFSLDDDVGIVSADERQARILGFDSVKELVGRPALSVMAPEERASMNDELLTAPRSGGSLSRLFLRQDGSVVPLDGMYAPGELEGRRVYAGILRPAHRWMVYAVEADIPDLGLRVGNMVTVRPDVSEGRVTATRALKPEEWGALERARSEGRLALVSHSPDLRDDERGLLTRLARTAASAEPRLRLIP